MQKEEGVLAQPSVQHDFVGKVARALDVRRERSAAQATLARQHMKEKLELIALDLQRLAARVEEESKLLGLPLQPSLLDELRQHGVVVVLDEEPDTEDHLALVAPGKEPDADYNPATDLIVDCHTVELRVDMVFRAYGYKLRERKNFEAPEPLEHLPAALAGLPFAKDAHISQWRPLDEWVEYLTDTTDTLRDEDIDSDHHYPTKARGTGYILTNITVMQFRE